MCPFKYASDKILNSMFLPQIKTALMRGKARGQHQHYASDMGLQIILCKSREELKLCSYTVYNTYFKNSYVMSYGMTTFNFT